MCQGGLKIGRVQGQWQVRGAVGVFGMGRQIPCPAPKAVPRLEAVCGVPAFRGWLGAEEGWGNRGLGLVLGNMTSC